MDSVPAWKGDYTVLRANPERWERHKETVRRRQRERYANDPEFRATHQEASGKAQKAMLRDPDKWSQRMVVRLRSKCRKNGIPFNITAADIEVPENCPVFGTEFIFGGVGGYKAWASPSVDRVIPHLGYVKGNVRVISNRANTIKNNATSAELRRLADYIDSNTLRNG